MSFRNPSNPADPSHVWDHDARVLAGVLRSSPLTVLLSPDGVDTTPMLLHGVMPKLRRRASDRMPRDNAPVGTVIPFADRRDTQAGLLARRDREIAVFFDAWNADPVAALLRQVRQAVDAPWMPPLAEDATLIGELTDLQSRHNLRFLLLLDRFEDALAHRVESPRIGEFIEQWLEAIAAPELAAHFLVALPEAELGRFDGVRERIANFDDRCLRANGSGRLFGLASVSPAIPADVMAAISATQSRVDEVPAAEVPTPLPPPLPTESDDAFLASLTEIGLRVAELAAKEEPRSGPASEEAASPLGAAEADTSRNTPPPTGVRTARDAAESRTDRDATPPVSGFDVPPPTNPGPALTPTLSRERERGQTGELPAASPSTRPPAYAWLVLPLIALAVWWWFERDAPSALPMAPRAETTARAPTGSLPTTEAPATPAAPPANSLIGPAALDIAVDPSNGTDARVARELTLSLAPPTGIELPAMPSRGGLATLVDLDAASTSPRLAITNYDALQAARTLALRPRLQIVTPLYMQEIYFIVRADSNLRFLHDLRGARIDAGPADGSRSLTAASVYRRLFDESLPATASTAHSEDDSLAELLAFQTIDVVATVGGQPLPWLANLPKATRDRIRLLRLDGRDPVDRRALQSFLPSTVHGLDLGGDAKVNTPTLAVMSFLVTNANPDDAQASARLTDFAKGLCQALPALRRSGHPKWSEVNPGLQLPTGFAESAAAQAGFADCSGSAPMPVSIDPAPARTSSKKAAGQASSIRATHRHHPHDRRPA